MVKQTRPHVVFNVAAFTDVDGAEEREEEALLVNGLGVRHLALACLEEGEIPLVHLSTDYVFEGEKGSPYGIYDLPRPLNAYGRTKLWGEKALQALSRHYYLVRTSWLFGPGGGHFVGRILEAARQNLAAAPPGKPPAPLRVVDDQYGSPTYTRDLARALADLVETGCWGTYHVTNTGVTTWYGLASRALELAGIPVPVLPVASSEFPLPAQRPRCSALDPFPLRETLGYLLPPWTEALERYLKEEGQRTPATPSPGRRL